MRTALVLAGHGSHISPQTAGLVWSHVDQLRGMQIADEVTAAFWKEAPAFSRVLTTIEADDITIVPIFTAQGYFTRSVIPAEMQLQGAVTTRAGRTVRYARTLSEHPHLAAIVRERVITGLHAANVSGDQAAVAILGHSTKRNPDSRKATEAQVNLLRQVGIASEVIALYLDDTPNIAQVFELTHAPIIIAVPFFVAFGSHVTLDVPAQLGLPPAVTRGYVQNRELIYTDPVGIDDTLGQIILDLAREAGAPLVNSATTNPSASAWAGIPTAGHSDFAQAVAASFDVDDGFCFGQVWITPTGVHHIDDIDASGLVTLTTSAQLRHHMREASGFRPLTTATDLPRGWRVPTSDLRTSLAVVETIYPGLIADWAASQAQTLTLSTLHDVAERQLGMFRHLANLTHEQQHSVVQCVCGNCVLHPLWFGVTSGELPCAEPCNWWMSAALEALSSTEASQ